MTHDDPVLAIGGKTDTRSTLERARDRLADVLSDAGCIPTPAQILTDPVMSRHADHVMLFHGIPLHAVFQLALEAVEQRLTIEKMMDADQGDRR